MSKEFGSSRSSGALNDVLSSRFSAPETEQETPAEQQASPATKPSRMTTRSWYLSRETADALREAADRIRHTVPAITKADALDALLRYAVDHETEISQKLAKSVTSGRNETS